MPYNKSFFEKIKQIKQTINDIKGKEIAAGFFQDKNTKDEHGVSLVEKAVMNNYGIGCPARPFATTTKDNFEKKHGTNVSKAIIRSIITGDKTYGERVMNDEANKFGEEFREAIKEWSTPQNATLTIAIKGFNDPLVHTGEMRDAPEGRIVDKKK